MAVVLQDIDYSKGMAPVVVRRVCGGRDVGCLDGLRRRQEGRVAGVKDGGGHSVAGGRRFAKPPGYLGRVSQNVDCSGDVAAALR